MTKFRALSTMKDMRCGGEIPPFGDIGFIISDWSKYLTEEQCNEYAAQGGVVNQ